MKKNYLKIIAGAILLFSIVLSGGISSAQSKKENLRRQHEGTLFGAMLDLFQKKAAVPERLITGKIEIEGFAALPYVRSIRSGFVSMVHPNGDFTINVPVDEKILVIGAPGLIEQTINLEEDETHYNILLRVVGDDKAYHGPALYGMNIDRRSFNGAYTTLTAQDIRIRNSATLDEVLEGAVPGLSTGGRWNGIRTNFSFTIRGKGSLLSASAPLVLLDGAPYTGALNTINPNDVQYLTVLRDAAGKAVYGSRGANGIILITTKISRNSYRE